MIAMLLLQVPMSEGQHSNDLSDNQIFRHNYGVVLEKVAQVQLATATWSHVFTVELPVVPPFESNVQLMACDQISRNVSMDRTACLNIRPVMLMLQELHRNITQHLNNTIEHVYAVLPTNYREVNNAARQTRALLGIVGEIFKGAFGTMSDSDRSHIDAQIRQIGQSQTTLAQAFSSETSKMASYLAAVNHRIDTVSKLAVDQCQFASCCCKGIASSVNGRRVHW